MTTSDFRAHRPTVTGTRHMVAAGHYLAAHVGFSVLEAGGNAVDAGVATGITEGVVESHFHAFSGVSPILVYQAGSGEVATIDGIGTWPKAASCQYFQDRFEGKIPQGDQSAIVPAPPDAWITALRRWGTMSFGEVAGRAIAFARDGFPMYPHMKMLIEDRVDLIRGWPGNSAVFLPDGRVPAVGELFRQPALAATLQHMADEEKAAAAKGGRDAGLRAARDAFYKGDIARAFAAYMKERHGLLTYDDMAGFEATVEPAVKGHYRDFELYGCGPWTGAPMLSQALGILDGLDLEGMGHNSPAYIHALTEAIKIAAADRHGYYGDPRFVDVPIDALLSPDYAAERRRLIDPGQALPDMPAPGRIEGVPWPATAPGLDGFPADAGKARAGALATTFFCVVDSQSNVFAS
ncbi:MAG: gamma-glutamyltransferase, partial [Rhodospirillales bacterium]|nr:gamma-glutamyltransferase [Rhodospirillales bacterium]